MVCKVRRNAESRFGLGRKRVVWIESIQSQNNFDPSPPDSSLWSMCPLDDLDAVFRYICWLWALYLSFDLLHHGSHRRSLSWVTHKRKRLASHPSRAVSWCRPAAFAPATHLHKFQYRRGKGGAPRERFDSVPNSK